MLPHAPFKGTVWRVVREGRDPCQCSASGGRWDDGSFDVLYTALDRDGAIAEMYFHLLRGQPVFPSKVRYSLHELKVELSETLHLATLPDLAALGLDTSRYGQLSYAGRNQEYPRTQEIAEVAHFLDCDGLLVPSARWVCSNLVIFCDRLGPAAIEAIKDHGLIDWARWQKENKAKL
ncbi:MAG: RES family NAD+ phosphorylase [Methylocella sp.]